MKNISGVVLFLFCVFNFSVSAQVEPDSAGTREPVKPDSTIGQPAPVEQNTPDKEGEAIVVPPPLDTLATSAAEPAPAGGPKQPTALRKANLFFTQQAYADAIVWYEKAKKTDPSNKLILSNLAESYRLTNNTQGQIDNYGALVAMNAAEPIQELYYGEALMQGGENEKARVYFERYSLDARGKELASSFERNKEFTKNADAYSLTPAPFNSPQSDICAVKYFDYTVFASTRAKVRWIKNEHAWTNSAFQKMYISRKDGNGKEMKPILFMSDLNSRFNDGPISLTKDFNMMYFTRNNPGKEEKSKEGLSKLTLLMAYMDETGFSDVELMPFDNIQYNYTHPSISPDGYTLFFASDMPGGFGGMDIYRVRKDSLGVWGKVENLGDKVNTAGQDVFPYFSPDSVLYFVSNGHLGLGGLDLYEAKLKGDKVTRIYNMGIPINSQYDDFGLFVAEDLKTGYLSSNRKAGGLDDDIYIVDYLRKVKRGKDVTLRLLDKQSGAPADSLMINVNGDTLYSNEKGELLLGVEDETQYRINFSHPGYFPLNDSLNSESSEEESFSREYIVEKDPKVELIATITDTKTKLPLDSVKIRVTDINNSFEFPQVLTGDSGLYNLKLPEKRIGDKLAYLIRLDRPGYLQRTVVYTGDVTQAGAINIDKELNFSLGKIEVGMDLAKMIDLKPIYFDLGKAKIRPDAAIELDKIVQVMNEYPGMYIELGAHTDCRSPAKANLKLSDERAKASAAYIVKKGIKKERIVGKGYGETKLLNDCACEGKVQSNCSEEEHALNRRTEFIITKMK